MTCLFLMKIRLKPLAAVLPLVCSFAPASAQQTGSASASLSLSTTLPSITVYASRFEEPLADALPQTLIVTAAEIQKSGASNVSEVLSRVAALPLRTNLDGSTNAVIDLRGYGDTASNNVVVLLDGVRLSENEQTVARTSMIPLEAIDHIEITQGGNSVLYGDGATGGTINIVTRKNAGDLTVLSGGLASYSGYQSGIYHSKVIGNSELSLFARQYASDNYRKSSQGNERSAGANWIQHIDPQTHIGARFFTSRERNKLPGALPSIYLDSTPRETQVPGYNYDAQVYSTSLTLFGAKSIGDVELAVDMNKKIRDNADSYRYDAYLVSYFYDPTIEEQAFGNSNSHTNTRSLSPRIKIRNFIAPNNTLQIGYDWQKTTKSGRGFLTFGYGSTGQSDYSLAFRKNGVYLRNIYELTGVDRFIFGFRKENYSQSYARNGLMAFEADGSVGAGEIQYSRKIDDNLSAYARLSQNFRIPNVDDNSNVSLNPLAVQVSKDFDLGFIQQSKDLSWGIGYFRSYVTNEIGYDPAGCSSLFQGVMYVYGCNVNFQPVKREGVNFRQSLTLSQAFTLRTNFQYVDASFVGGVYGGKSVPSVAPLTGQLTLDFQMNSKEQISVTSRFAQSRRMSGDYLNEQRKVAGYAVQDLSYFYKADKWSWVASIRNIANKKHSDVGIAKPSSAGYLDPYNLTVYPSAGRSFSLTGRYVF